MQVLCVNVIDLQSYDNKCFWLLYICYYYCDIYCTLITDQSNHYFEDLANNAENK